MNDIELGISKSRGYENVDLEELRNKKTPQDAQDQVEYTIGGYPTVVKLPLSFSCDEFNTIGVITVEIYNSTSLKTSIHDVIERGCETILSYFKEGEND